MRLIDADAFKNYIQSGLEDVRHFFKDNEKWAEAVVKSFCEDIDEQPTIELPKWIPCSERLPKENECVGNVWKYYLIQDEYEDMHVAHLSSRGWETIESFKALECDVVAWMPLPEKYKVDNDGDK